MDQFLEKYGEFEPHYEAVYEILGTVTKFEARSHQITIEIGGQIHKFVCEYENLCDKSLECAFVIYCGLRTIQNYHNNDIINHFIEIMKFPSDLAKYRDGHEVELLNSCNQNGNIFNVIAYMLFRSTEPDAMHEFVFNNLDILLQECTESALKYMFFGMRFFVKRCLDDDKMDYFDRCYDHLGEVCYGNLDIDDIRKFFVYIKEKNDDFKGDVFKYVSNQHFTGPRKEIGELFLGDQNIEGLRPEDLPSYLGSVTCSIICYVFEEKYYYRIVELSLNHDVIGHLWSVFNTSFNDLNSLIDEGIIDNLRNDIPNYLHMAHVAIFETMYNRSELQPNDVVNFVRSISERYDIRKCRDDNITPRLLRRIAVHLLIHKEEDMLKKLFEMYYDRIHFIKDLLLKDYEDSEGWGKYNTLLFIPFLEKEIFGWLSEDILTAILVKYESNRSVGVNVLWDYMKKNNGIRNVICKDDGLLSLFYDFILDKSCEGYLHVGSAAAILYKTKEKTDEQKKAATELVWGQGQGIVLLQSRELYQVFHGFIPEEVSFLYFKKAQFKNVLQFAHQFSDSECIVFLRILKVAKFKHFRSTPLPTVQTSSLLPTRRHVEKTANCHFVWALHLTNHFEELFLTFFKHLSDEEFRDIFNNFKMYQLGDKFHNLSHNNRRKVLKKIEELKITAYDIFNYEQARPEIVVYSDCPATQSAVQCVSSHFAEQQEGAVCVFLNNSALGAVKLTEENDNRTGTMLDRFKSSGSKAQRMDLCMKTYVSAQLFAIISFLCLIYSGLHLLFYDTLLLKVENEDLSKMYFVYGVIVVILIKISSVQFIRMKFSEWYGILVYILIFFSLFCAPILNTRTFDPYLAILALSWLISSKNPRLGQRLACFTVIPISIWCNFWDFFNYKEYFVTLLFCELLSGIFNSLHLNTTLILSIVGAVLFAEHGEKTEFLISCLIVFIVFFGICILFWKKFIKVHLHRDFTVQSMKNEEKSKLQYNFNGKSILLPITEIPTVYIDSNVHPYCSFMDTAPIFPLRETLGASKGRVQYISYDEQFNGVEKYPWFYHKCSEYDIFGLDGLEQLLSEEKYVKIASLFFVTKESIHDTIFEFLGERLKQLSDWKVVEMDKGGCLLRKNETGRVIVLRIEFAAPKIISREDIMVNWGRLGE
ncbi:hypothetical protein PCE1_001257 [Barthelona sp. PCE]